MSGREKLLSYCHGIPSEFPVPRRDINFVDKQNNSCFLLACQNIESFH